MQTVWNGIECERRRWLTGSEHAQDVLHSAPYLYLIRQGTIRVTGGGLSATGVANEVLWLTSGLSFRLQSLGDEDAVADVWRLRRNAFAGAVVADHEALAWCRACSHLSLEQGLLLPVTRLTARAIKRLGGGADGHWRGREPWRHLRLKAAGLQVLALLTEDRQLQAALAGQSEVARDRLMIDLLEWIEDHLEQPLTVDGLARRAGLSRSRFCERFKQAVGLTFGTHLRRARVARACDLLRQTDDDVLQIGYAAGFGSPARFHAAFKRVTGTSPARWRRSVPMLGRN